MTLEKFWAKVIVITYKIQIPNSKFRLLVLGIWSLGFPNGISVRLSLQILRLDAHRRVRNDFQTLLTDEFSGHFADAVSLVLDTEKSVFQVADKLLLTDCQLRVRLF